MNRFKSLNFLSYSKWSITWIYSITWGHTLAQIKAFLYACPLYDYNCVQYGSCHQTRVDDDKRESLAVNEMQLASWSFYTERERERVRCMGLSHHLLRYTMATAPSFSLDPVGGSKLNLVSCLAQIFSPFSIVFSSFFFSLSFSCPPCPNTLKMPWCPLTRGKAQGGAEMCQLSQHVDC